MRTIKFIKVNMIIVNIVLVIYEILTAWLAITLSYNSDREIALFAFGISTLAIFVTNISGKKLIEVFEKNNSKKK